MIIPSVFINEQRNPEIDWLDKATVHTDVEGAIYRIKNEKLFHRRVLSLGELKFAFEQNTIDHNLFCGQLPSSQTPLFAVWQRVDGMLESEQAAMSALHNSIYNYMIKEDHTYTLIGPHVKPNRYRMTKCVFVPHVCTDTWINVPTDYGELKQLFKRRNKMHGLVWRHPDGRVARVTRQELGLPAADYYDLPMCTLNREGYRKKRSRVHPKPNFRSPYAGILDDITKAIYSDVQKFPLWADDIVPATTKFAFRINTLQQAILSMHYEKFESGTVDDFRKRAIEIIAMNVRLIKSLDSKSYYVPGCEQHEQ